ncbi:DUF397 domain-containing protein [Streptomyces sp. NPDC047860]|uniref:DUF397 domain-containing protein n=1 Tax=Streptomyces sp. NPDC047860 TaxID=3155743 RepID=UPI00340BD0DD
MPTIRWRKSSRSGDSSNCVEIATDPAAVLVRDSKTTPGPLLDFSPTMWAAFLTAVGEATRGGVPLGRTVTVGGWEMKFSQRPTDPLPALMHAFYVG